MLTEEDKRDILFLIHQQYILERSNDVIKNVTPTKKPVEAVKLAFVFGLLVGVIIGVGIGVMI